MQQPLKELLLTMCLFKGSALDWNTGKAAVSVSVADFPFPVKHCSHSWGNLSGLTLNLALGYPVRLLLCTLRLGGVQRHSGHRTKPRKSHHSLPSNSMSFQATSPHFEVVIWMAETVHYRSLWILSGLCKHIWHVSAVELQFSKANHWTYGAAPAAIFGRNHDSNSYAPCRCFRKTVRMRHGQGWG